ncbi:hypothetical protein L208DRAFT_1369278 [Tricholoma matsutake]|nr:hypothetical protein L208DRAFT_1369278 [Tricholoma matsutake 945]
MSQSPTPFEKQDTSSNLKRKERSQDPDDNVIVTTKRENDLPLGSSIPQGEYASGLIRCDICGTMVSFRNQITAEFTLTHWNHHRETCVLPSPPITSIASNPVIYTPESTAEALAHPRSPPKRRRVKRSEEERIAYLRDDLYVAKFDAYRALCASCDKWIRLRPNSTYCSIPWEAHRKGCLARRPNVHTPEERDQFFTKDPGIHKFDAKSVLCAICNTWVVVHPGTPGEVVEKWLQHRSTCQKVTVPTADVRNEDKTIDSQITYTPTPASLQSGGMPPSSPYITTSPTVPPARPILPVPKPCSSASQRTSLRFPFILCNPEPTPKPVPSNIYSSNSNFPNPSTSPISNPSTSTISNPSTSTISNPSTSNLTPTTHVFPILNYGSQRRTAEQRAASLRADRLLGAVEPNRVFCSVCRKWVQLRRDSSYCSYPWVQHRGKCLARAQRRALKQNERVKGKNHCYAFGLDSGGSSGGSSGHANVRSGLGCRPAPDINTGAMSTDEDDSTGSEDDSRPTTRSGKHDLSRSPTRSGIISQDPSQEQRSSYQRYHHLENYHRVERQDYPRLGEAQCRHRSHPQPQPQPRFQCYHSRVEGSVKPTMFSLGARVCSHTSSRGSSVQTTAYHSDTRAYSFTPARSHYSSFESTPSLDDEAVYVRPADLISPSGRKTFILTSITHLFSTTFDTSTDVLSVRALVAYLNAALPPDKWEEFDEKEVKSALEGDECGDNKKGGKGKVWAVRGGEGDGDNEVVCVSVGE